MSKRKPPGASPVKEKQSQHGKPIMSPPSVSQQQQTHGGERMPSLCKCKAAPSSLEPSQLQPPYSDLLAQENPERMMSLLQSFLLGNILKSCVKLYCRQLWFWKLVSIQKRLKSVFPRTKILFRTLEVGSKIPYFMKEDRTSCQRKSMGRGKLSRTHISK